MGLGGGVRVVVVRGRAMHLYMLINQTIPRQPGCILADGEFIENKKKKKLVGSGRVVRAV